MKILQMWSCHTLILDLHHCSDGSNNYCSKLNNAGINCVNKLKQTFRDYKIAKSGAVTKYSANVQPKNCVNDCRKPQRNIACRGENVPEQQPHNNQTSPRI